MRVSKVTITPIMPDKGLIAFASVVIDENLYLNSIAIYTKLDGTYRLLYPTKNVGNRSLSLFHPINKSASKIIEKAVFKRCEEVFEGRSSDRHYQNSRVI